MLCMSTLVAITYGCIDIIRTPCVKRKHSPFGQLATDWEKWTLGKGGPMFSDSVLV